MDVRIYDRINKNIYLEKQFRNQELIFLYNSFIGRIMLNLIIKQRWFSKIYSLTNKRKKSISKIEPFIKEYDIDMSDFEPCEYQSFNDFFIRKTALDKRIVSTQTNALIAVSDAKLSAYSINEELSLEIKGNSYTIDSLLKDEMLSHEFKNGTCLVFRLTVDDYHRYCFPDDGKIVGQKEIFGCLHTVGPISAQEYKVFCENHRKYAILETQNFGKIIQMEIGALLVGKIVNNEITNFRKGMEKGYFEFGGSTIILLFKEGTVKIDEDIIKHSSENIETRVRFGEKIGESYDKTS